jgi:beta-lactamase class A
VSGEAEHADLAAAVRRVVADDPTLTWGIRVIDLADRTVLAEHAPDAVLPLASVGKVLLLVEVARAVADGTLRLDEQLRRTPADWVGDSGLWQHLATDTLPVEDLAALVGSVSDNLATNVLLRRIGLATVAATAAALRLEHTALLDRVRDVRAADDPPTLSRGTARELTELLARLARGRVVSAPVSARVLRWLGLGTDTSMVAAAWRLDPLAHTQSDRGLVLHHKTGTDTGIRADAGVLHGPAASVAYAVAATWEPAGPDRRAAALAGMVTIGRLIGRHVDDLETRIRPHR